MIRPLVIGHRGAPKFHLENTLESFQSAIDLGIDMIELDVQTTSDGHLVVFHDENLERLASIDEFISNVTLREIQEIKIGSASRIPTLDDVLSISKDHLMVNIEVKAPAIEHQVLSLVKNKGMLEQVLFSSFHHDIISRILELEPTSKTGILYSTPIEDVVSYATDIGTSAINPLFFLLEPSIVEQAHEKGLMVYPWTVNDSEMMKALIEMGVDGIISDLPDLCLDMVKEVYG